MEVFISTFFCIRLFVFFLYGRSCLNGSLSGFRSKINYNLLDLFIFIWLCDALRLLGLHQTYNCKDTIIKFGRKPDKEQCIRLYTPRNINIMSNVAYTIRNTSWLRSYYCC